MSHLINNVDYLILIKNIDYLQLLNLKAKLTIIFTELRDFSKNIKYNLLV